MRAIFVLTNPKVGQQFLRVLPDLRGIGLSQATILHMVSAKRGPAEPMPELANWVRHFEAVVPSVELALKRGDAVKWIYELARVREVDLVVISSAPNGSEWDLERVSSPLRALRIPVLLLPEKCIHGSLADRVLIAVKAPDSLGVAVSGLAEWFPPERLQAVRVVRSARRADPCHSGGVSLEVVSQEGDVATTLLRQAERCGASLLAILAHEEGEANAGLRGYPVVQPLIESAPLPLLIWPTEAKGAAPEAMAGVRSRRRRRDE